MKTVLVAAIFLAVVYDVSGRQIHSVAASRTVGGSTASIEKYPYQVSLRRYFKHFCGGSILNTRWILTAAQCIADKKSYEISVIAGTNTLAEAGQMYQAIFTSVHVDYDQSKHLNDIALIVVSREIVFGLIKPTTLPNNNFYKYDYPATVTGWGSYTWENYKDELQETSVTVISQGDCRAFYGKLDDSQICTRNSLGVGVCGGDSGDPLVADGVQIGIASASDAPCARGNPDVYTRIWSFVPWITTTMKNHKV